MTVNIIPVSFSLCSVNDTIMPEMSVIIETGN